MNYQADHKSVMQKSFTCIKLNQIRFAKDVFKLWKPWPHPENFVVQIPFQVQIWHCDQYYSLSAPKSQHSSGIKLKVKRHFRQKAAKE